MAVELMGFPKIDEQKAIQEAASQGLKSMENLIRLLSHQQQANSSHLNSMDYTDLTDLTVSKFKKVISLLNRTGHARFRRGPLQTCSSSSSPPSSSSSASLSLPQPQHSNLSSANVPPATIMSPATHIIARAASFVQSQPQSMTLDFTRPNILNSNPKTTELEFTKDSFSVSSSSSFMSSAITGDGSVSNGKQGSIFLTPAPTVSGGKPPLSTAPFKKRCHEHHHSDDASGKFSGSGSGSGKCHCSKRRYACVPHLPRNLACPFECVAFNEKSGEENNSGPGDQFKIADIPPDEYSWRKYGQNRLKAHHTRARKHVERAPDDPTMLIVTYEGEHRHSQPPALQDSMAASEVGLVFESTRGKE
ncbi:hypothetical protein FNV43_RR11688 [Rhamnella rubrinervis]|uniref:WRKY domain-containing protein n=1 Tax=Rhamnella rubrinervis TaxID=2594499 RepID=A0A8K0MHI9_9ROSA|nr:hypothetical protein FNV43_RR11688 [Rhamnella rubrinervis]